MKLYSYSLSSASFRVRIALNLKGLSPDYVARHLRKGEQSSPDYLKINPQGLVPALELNDGSAIAQSMAIIEYLDETYPNPPLIPKDPLGRARVRALSQAICCDIHPLNNLRVLQYLTKTLKIEEEPKNTWYRHWVIEGFRGLEADLSTIKATGRFCHGDSVTMADLCLVPQIFNAQRFQTDLTPYPTIRRIHEACMELEAFKAAVPSRQPDAPPPA